MIIFLHLSILFLFIDFLLSLYNELDLSPVNLSNFLLNVEEWIKDNLSFVMIHF